MGATATASRSSPTGKMTTRLARIFEYSKLVRAPVLQPRTFDKISFDDLFWDVTVKPWEFNDEGLADRIHVSVVVSSAARYSPDLVLQGIDISIEILDETGEHTVFHKESNAKLQDERGLILGLYKRELEASSCLHNDDSFTVRCTQSKHQAPTWWRWRLFSEPNKKLSALEPMAGSHVLTVGSFSKLKAKLRGGECTYSTQFAVGGCRWFFQFCPNGVVGLVRSSYDRTPTTAEFSFELEGAVNFKSEKMTHTFDRLNSRYLYRYRLEPSTSAMHDRLIVRCRLAVMVVKEPSLPPRAESIPTPLLKDKYD